MSDVTAGYRATGSAFHVEVHERIAFHLHGHGGEVSVSPEVSGV
jgi:hypothetical protein